MRANRSTAIGAVPPHPMAANDAKVVIDGQDETMIDIMVVQIRGARGVPAGTAGEARFSSGTHPLMRMCKGFLLHPVDTEGLPTAWSNARR